MVINLKSCHDDLLFIPLGGSNEIGMNLNLYHLHGKWLLVDLGIGFADDYLPGIEIVLPDIEFLIEHREDILGLVVTHAHEDHLGAVPYLWEELHCPLYTTPFTAAVLKAKLASEGMTGTIPITEVKIGSRIQLGSFALEMVPLTHSIPEMQALAIATPKGTIIHTGDWKLDSDPLVGPTSDEETLKKYGDAGVLAMVCDSTNVFVEGESGSESGVRKALETVVSQCAERVFITTFASNIARVESIMRAGHACGRQVVLAGRSLWRIYQAARDSGYLEDLPEPLSENEGAGLARRDALIICTGCQGEPRAALSKVVAGAHPNLRIAADDTVIFSSRVIPGNENRIRWIRNQMVGQGIHVITDKDAPIHVSGHPARAELARMYQLVRPQIAVPVHGEAAHIHEHARFATGLQVPEVVEGYNGAVIKLEKGGARIIDEVRSGYIAVDGTSLIKVKSPVISMRRKLRDDGNITVSFVLDKGGHLLSRPEITAPGSLDSEEDEALRHALEDDVIAALENMPARPKLHTLKDKVRNAVRRRIQQELGKRPVLEVHVHQI